MQFYDIAVYCENSTKQANKLHGQNAGLNVGAGGACCYHCSLKR
jgi:hypothetical protein